jgi:phosphatidylserine decarboxylase
MSVMDKDLVIAPCDGKVVQVRKVEEDEYLKTECYQISIFMSVLNVHVNYYPVSGKILYSKHHQGAYIVASYPKASVLNERTSIAVETADGAKVLFRQIAGYIARRIVCYAEVGEQATQCSQVGFIKFGSRMDVFIPVTSQVNVKVGDKVRACETVIAKMKKVHIGAVITLPRLIRLMTYLQSIRMVKYWQFMTQIRHSQKNSSRLNIRAISNLSMS